MCSLPNEVLNQVAVILGQQKLLGKLDNLPRILHQQLSIVGELVGRAAEGPGLQKAVQGNVDLFVLQAWSQQIAARDNASEELVFIQKGFCHF